MVLKTEEPKGVEEASHALACILAAGTRLAERQLETLGSLSANVVGTL